MPRKRTLVSGAEADSTSADRGLEVLCLTRSNVDGDEVCSKVTPHLLGFHLPQEVGVVADVAYVACELEEAEVQYVSLTGTGI